MYKCTVYNLFLSKPHKDGDDHSKRSAFVHLKTATLFFGYEQTTSKYAHKIYKDGKIIIGGLLKTHYSETGNQCNRLSTTDLGNAKAMIYAIERMNTNFTLVPNVPIGYELRDYCWSGALVTQTAYELMRGNYPGLIKTPAFFRTAVSRKTKPR